jgi:hypothetical protein
MESGCYGCYGRVVKVTPSGVDVQTPEIVGGLPSIHAELLHFDNNGRSYVTELPSSYDSTAHPASPWRWDGNGTLECGPWYIVGPISKEEIASWEGTIAKNNRQRFNPPDGRPESDGKKK